MKEYSRLEAEHLRDVYRSTYYPTISIDYDSTEQEILHKLTSGYYYDESEFYSDLSMVYDSYLENND